jgi:hypothetical protein
MLNLTSLAKRYYNFKQTEWTECGINGLSLKYLSRLHTRPDKGSFNLIEKMLAVQKVQAIGKVEGVLIDELNFPILIPKHGMYIIYINHILDFVYMIILYIRLLH